MNLTEMRPQKSTLKLSQIKGELVLNPITLADEAWLDQEYGPEKIQQIFNDVNIKEISRIVFRLLDTPSKKRFAKQKVDFVDENGEVTEIEIGGVELLRQVCVGWDDKLALLQSLIDNLGISRPAVDPDEPKKKVKKARAKKK